MIKSVSFDRAADSYDATRALPPDIAAKLTDAIAAELSSAGANHVLEAGIGTGRITRPLMARGVRVTGIDISSRMLARLREQVGPQDEPPDLAFADATRLPFASGSFRAVLVFHVLHLVSDWRQAVEEARRLLAPGGLFMQDNTHFAGEPHWDASAAKWKELMAARNFVPRPRPSLEEVHDALRALGGSSRIVIFAEGEDRRTPGEYLEEIRNRVHSWTWEVPDDIFAGCLREFEPWYRQHYRDMDTELVDAATYELEVWKFA